jgi:ribonuclease HI
LCSDGGRRNGIAGFGIVLSINQNTIITTRMRLKEEFGEYTPYRSEGFGLLGALILYNKLQEYTAMVIGSRQPTTVTLYCDSESLVDVVHKQSWTQFTNKFHYSADADVIKEIVLLLRLIRGHQEIAIVRHVKGHQDRGTNPLSYAATLNVTADHLATESLHHPIQQHLIELPSTTATIYIGGESVSSNYTQHLREAFLLIPYRTHTNNINNWADDVFDKVWWEPHGTAMNKYGTHQQLMLQKYINNRLPTNRREHRYYE